ncbi:extracellular solute-binding protein [Tenggerimyces flavus]|uniref:Extracellular solute-binding protein n=1 Tax=Tenggerimyces flavus TaxID=1708749 RepID=A0ABV7YEP4_9ACTN|nr:extracellular solute-binding protein [Tenggerimyces flavus]MBM7786712.1 putative aldouronate transport system substrate-binding protein [Tenggerimyces flavus]
MGQDSERSGRIGRRGFLKGVSVAAGIGLAPWLAAACGNGPKAAPTKAGAGLDAAFFERPDGAIKDLSLDQVPAAQQKTSYEQWVARAEGAYDPPIKLTTVAQTSPVTKYPKGDTLAKNVWTRAYESRYGISVETKWSVDQSQWEQRTNLMIGSGDLPDFFLASQSQLDQLIRADLIADLTATYKDHATDQVRATILEAGPTALESAVYGGKLMAIPFVEQNETAPHWFIRKDLLDKAGLGVPKTMRELLDACAAFTSNGTYGLAVGPSPNQDLGYLQAFFNGYHAYRGLWIEKDGKLAYSSVQPEMRAALEQLQRMYKAKQIHPEFGTRTEEQVFEDWANGKVGLIQGRGSGPNGTDILKTNNPKAEVVALPVLSMDGEPAKAQVDQPNVRGYWVVRKGAEHPEALLKMLDFWVSTFYLTPSDEVQAAFISDGEEPNLWTLNKIALYRAYKNTDVHNTLTKLLDSKSADVASYRPEVRFWYDYLKPAFTGGKIDGYQYRSLVGYYGPNSGRAVQDLYRKQDLYMPDGFFGVPTATMSRRQASLDKIEAETFTKVIQGSPIAEFDTFVKEWKSVGGDQVTREVNEWREQQRARR